MHMSSVYSGTSDIKDPPRRGHYINTTDYLFTRKLYTKNSSYSYSYNLIIHTVKNGVQPEHLLWCPMHRLGQCGSPQGVFGHSYRVIFAMNFNYYCLQIVNCLEVAHAVAINNYNKLCQHVYIIYTYVPWLYYWWINWLIESSWIFCLTNRNEHETQTQ